MKTKGYIGLLLAAAMVAASPAAVFAQETDIQMTSEVTVGENASEVNVAENASEVNVAENASEVNVAENASEVNAVENASDPSISEQLELPVLPAAVQASDIKIVSFADTDAVSQDGIICSTVADDENGFYVITYGDDEHPVLDTDQNEITEEYVTSLVNDLIIAGNEIQTNQQVIETFNIDYVVDGEEMPLESPCYVILKIDGLTETDPVTILHQEIIGETAEWAPLEIVAQGDEFVCVRFDSFSPTVVLAALNAAVSANAPVLNANVNSTQNINSANGSTGSGNSTNTGNAAGNNGSGGNVQNNSQGNANNAQNNDGAETANTHVHNLTLVPAVAATSTQDGNIAYYKCDGCGKMFADENGTTEVTDVIDHNWGQWIVTQMPTAAQAGIQERTCTVCGEKETKDIPPGTDMTTYNPNQNTTNTAAGNGLSSLNSANTANTASTIGSPPKTGDQTALPVYYTLLAMAAAGLLITVIWSKRRRES